MTAPRSAGADFNLEYFRGQLKHLKHKSVAAKLAQTSLTLTHVERMLDCMTVEEREHPEIIDEDRTLRIAMLSGVKPHEIHEFLWQFSDFRRACNKLSSLTRDQRQQIMTHPEKLRELLD